MLQLKRKGLNWEILRDYEPVGMVQYQNPMKLLIETGDKQYTVAKTKFFSSTFEVTHEGEVLMETDFSIFEGFDLYFKVKDNYFTWKKEGLLSLVYSLKLAGSETVVGIGSKYSINKKNWELDFPNNAEIWFPVSIALISDQIFFARYF